MGAGKTTGVLDKTMLASGAIAENLIVKMGSDDDHVSAAAAVGDLMIGVSASEAAAAEDQIRVQMNGIADVKIGGSVTRGNEITSNASGQGVAAAPATGVNNRIIGMAMKSGVSGDIIPVLLSMGIKQG